MGSRTTTTDRVGRQRKSRAGCRNCKIRKVKCDETKPTCRKCEAYGVVCNYKRTDPDLQPAPGHGSQWGVFSLKESPHGKYQSNASAPAPAPRTSSRRFPGSTDGCSTPLTSQPSNPLISADDASSLELDARSVGFLDSFRRHTAATLGGQTMQRIVDTQILPLAFSSPVLMHASLAVAAAHVRHLRSPVLTKRPLTEIHHWSRCTTLFNRKLSSPIRPQDRDVLWATATYLGIVCFASLDITSPSEAWPLRPVHDPSDLEWLRMSTGKAVIWRLTDPLREGSIFRPMAPVFGQLHAPLPSSGLAKVPPVFQQLCGIDGASTAGNNPYYTAVQALARLSEFSRARLALYPALAFISYVEEDFMTLLEQKEPVALLLLSLWYAGASRAVWWIERRAEVEGRAVCLYLERHHWDNATLMELLPWKSARYEGVLAAKGLYDFGHMELLEEPCPWWTPLMR